jgi:O-antigen ligase
MAIQPLFAKPKAIGGFSMLNNIRRRAPVPVEEQPSVAARWLALYIVVAVGRLTDILPFAHSWPLAKMTFLIVLLAAFRGRAGVSPVRLSSIDLSRGAIIFTVLVVASLLFSVYKSLSFAFIIGTFLTVSVGFFVSVKVLARWCDIRAVLKAFAIVGLILSAEALAGYSGGRAFVQSMYDTNDLAYVLMGVLPIALAFGVISPGLSRYLWLGVAALIAAAGLLTQSRGGLLALAAIVLMLVWKPLRAPAAIEAGKGAGGVLVRALLAILLSVTAWTQLPVDAQHRLGLLVSLQDDYNTDLSNRTGRSSIWKRNTIAGLERPIGSGVDTFTYVDATTGGNYMAPHNSVIEVFVELGVLGLILWLRLWFLGWRSLQPPATTAADAPSADTQQKRGEQVVFAQALRISLVALFVAGFFLSMSFSVILWEILAVCAAMGVVFGRHAKKAAVVPRRRPFAGLA